MDGAVEAERRRERIVRMDSRPRPARAVALTLVVLLGLALAAGPAAADPIAPGTATSLPTATGGPVRAQPVAPTRVPQNPGLARNPRSNIHDDTWMTDSYPFAGPLGRASVLGSGAMPPAVCGSLAFDRAGRIVSVCPSVAAAPQARVIDPATLRVLASLDLPQAPDAPGTKAFQNFTGGGYFFLDGRDRIWSATKTSHLVVIAEGPGGTSLRKVADYDLTGVLDPDERVTS